MQIDALIGAVDFSKRNLNAVCFFKGNDTWRVLLSLAPIAIEVTGLVNDQCIMRHGLFCPGFILRQIPAAELGLDIEETGSAIIGDNFIAIIIIEKAKLIMVTMPQPLGRGLHDRRSVVTFRTGSEHHERTLVTIRAITELL